MWVHLYSLGFYRDLNEVLYEISLQCSFIIYYNERLKKYHGRYRSIKESINYFLLLKTTIYLSKLFIIFPLRNECCAIKWRNKIIEFIVGLGVFRPVQRMCSHRHENKSSIFFLLLVQQLIYCIQYGNSLVINIRLL